MCIENRGMTDRSVTIDTIILGNALLQFHCGTELPFDNKAILMF